MAIQKRRQHHIVYIPGLGDTKYQSVQKVVVSIWRVYGVYGHSQIVGWNNDESFDDKLKRVLEQIDDLTAEGYDVSLMGSSAGASMALHAYAARKDNITGVVLICGELGDADNIADKYYRQNPAFETSMRRLPKTLKKLDWEDRRRIMSIHPLYDETVPIKDTQLKGAHMFTSISFGHSVTIAFTLTIDFFIPMGFLMRWAFRKR